MPQPDHSVHIRQVLQKARLFEQTPPRLLEDVVASGSVQRFEHGQVVYRQGDTPRVLVLESGLIRLYLSAPNEGEATVSYLRERDVFGLFFLGGSRPAISAQVLVTTQAVQLPDAVLGRLAEESAPFARELAHELLRRWEVTLAMLGMNTFGSIRQRLIHHLLSVAQPDARGNGLMVPTTHQELADAVGTARDVASRVLRNLQSEGALRLGRGTVHLIDARALEDEVRLVFPNETRVLLPRSTRA